MESIRHKVDKEIDKYTNQGSNWIVTSINNVKLCLVRYHAITGGADEFKVPQELAAKTCVLNIQTQKQECFKYAVVAALHFEEVDQHHKNRRPQYDQFVARYNWENIEFPSTAEDIKQFVKQNEGVAINALEWKPVKDDNPAHVVPVWHPPHKVVLNRQLATILFVNGHWGWQ